MLVEVGGGCKEFIVWGCCDEFIGWVVLVFGDFVCFVEFVWVLGGFYYVEVIGFIVGCFYGELDELVVIDEDWMGVLGGVFCC